MLSLARGLTRPAQPQTPLRQAMKALLATVLTEAGLPGPLQAVAQTYFIRASDEQLEDVVDTMERVVAELRRAQREGYAEVIADPQVLGAGDAGNDSGPDGHKD